MEVVFSQQAELDLGEIADTIAIDSAPAAIRFIQAIREHCTWSLHPLLCSSALLDPISAWCVVFAFGSHSPRQPRPPFIVLYRSGLSRLESIMVNPDTQHPSEPG